MASVRRSSQAPAAGGLTYVSLFSGAGIGCHGFDLAGFQCLATVETVGRRLQIQRFNRKCRLESGYICGSLQDPAVQARIWQELGRHGLAARDLDVLVATPPCQGMSVCNHKKGDERARNSLVVEAIGLASALLPKVFVFENVRRFLETPCQDKDGQQRPIGEALRRTLRQDYELFAQVVNLKNHGCPSSRTRTLVVGVRKDLAFSPLDLWPDWTPERTLRQAIGDLPALDCMGEVSSADIYHSFRDYPPRMRPWLQGLQEGQSAFDRDDPMRAPHRVIDGRVVPNKRGNGDKYRRQRWDAMPPCVHTRNDIMASQNTVHPRDDRVFSIREVMRMLAVPQDYRWSEASFAALNRMPVPAKKRFLKENEMNIRQCLGEAVPTEVFRRIADKARAALTAVPLPARKVRDLIDAYELGAAERLHEFVAKNPLGLTLDGLMTVAEHANTRRLENAAYYTPAKTCFKLLEMLPLPAGKRLRILEPAVGVGRLLALLPPLLARYEHVEIDAMDVDADALALARVFLKKVRFPGHVKIRFLHGDFLREETSARYDWVIANPPFGPLRDRALAECRAWAQNKQTRNVFAFFVEKALSAAANAALITPKSLLSAPELAATRDLLRDKVAAVCDYGELGFKGVKIETLGLVARQGSSPQPAVHVESVPLNLRTLQARDYAFDKAFPAWLIYRDGEFDRVAASLDLGYFQAFRDRQITRRQVNSEQGIRVLKSRNIGNCKVIATEQDVFVQASMQLAVKRFMGDQRAILVPNLSYAPRACRLPANCVTDGSVAILTPRNGGGAIAESSLSYFASDEFRRFYRVARNHGTRSLNIDASSVYFFGVKVA